MKFKIIKEDVKVQNESLARRLRFLGYQVSFPDLRDNWYTIYATDTYHTVLSTTEERKFRKKAFLLLK